MHTLLRIRSVLVLMVTLLLKFIKIGVSLSTIRFPQSARLECDCKYLHQFLGVVAIPELYLSMFGSFKIPGSSSIIRFLWSLAASDLGITEAWWRAKLVCLAAQDWACGRIQSDEVRLSGRFLGTWRFSWSSTLNGILRWRNNLPVSACIDPLRFVAQLRIWLGGRYIYGFALAVNGDPSELFGVWRSDLQARA